MILVQHRGGLPGDRPCVFTRIQRRQSMNTTLMGTYSASPRITITSPIILASSQKVLPSMAVSSQNKCPIKRTSNRKKKKRPSGTDFFRAGVFLDLVL